MGAGARGINLLKWIITFTVICSIMLLLRLWAARIQKRKAYADDWMVLVAFVSLISTRRSLRGSATKPSRSSLTWYLEIFRGVSELSLLR